MWGEDSNSVRPELFQRRDRSRGPHGDSDASAFRKFGLQLVRGGNAAPEAFKRNADDEMIKPAGHDLIDGSAHALAHHRHMFEEGFFGIERALLDGDTAGMAGDAGHAQPLALTSDSGAFGLVHHPDPLSRSPRIG